LIVGKKSESDFVFLNGLADFDRLVRRNSNDLKSQTAELWLSIAQLNQLPVTVGSPATAIKDENGGLCLNGRHQFEWCSVGGLYAYLRDLDSIQ
jgi:hypothetical protein